MSYKENLAAPNELPKLSSRIRVRLHLLVVSGWKDETDTYEEIRKEDTGIDLIEKSSLRLIYSEGCI